MGRDEAVRAAGNGPDPHDRRGVLVRLTDQGRTKVDGALASLLDRERELLAGLDASSQQRLFTIGEQVRAQVTGLLPNGRYAVLASLLALAIAVARHVFSGSAGSSY